MISGPVDFEETNISQIQSFYYFTHVIQTISVALMIGR